MTGLFLAAQAFAAVEGTAAFDSQRYSLTDVPTLTIADADLNDDPASEQIVSVTLSSTTDPVGINVTLRESGNDTGVFNEATEGVEFSTLASNDLLNTLRVSPDDTLTLAYTDAAPSGIRTATATMFANTGTIDLDDTRYGTGDTATVTVTDVDGNDSATVAETVTATLTSPEDATGVVVTLTETGVDTGTFTGTATFEDDGGSSTGTSLEIDPGETITATYIEPLFDGTTTADRTDTALMQVDGSASLDALRYDFNDTTTLTVEDDDLNTDPGSAQTVDVNLASKRHPIGITVSLIETGNDTGTFSGTATFVEGGSSSGTTLSADQGDDVTLTYAETTTETGAPADRIDTATTFSDGATAAMDLARYAFDDTVTLTVTDQDRNTDTTTAQTVSVSLRSTSDAALGISVTLTETGADTGIFTGTATFSTMLSNDLMDRLLVDEGDTVTMTYAEPNPSGTGTTDRIATATMLEDGNAVPALDARRFTTSATPGLSVTDPDANALPAVAESIQVTLTSGTDGTGITIDLTESGADTGVFDIADVGVGFTTLGSSNDATNTLRVTTGDTLTLTHAEPRADGSGTDPRTATATVFVDDATATLDALRYAADDTATISVTDADMNSGASSAQTLQVKLTSTTDATGISVTLTETGVDTSTFTGPATFSASGPSSGTVLHVAAGDTVTATYAEPDADGAGTTARTDDAGMHLDGFGAIAALRYRIGTNAILTVVDEDLNTSSDSVQTVNVTLDDVTDALGTITVQLTETGVDTGVFSGVASFTTGLTNDAGDELHVAAGDTVRLTYAETTTFSGTNIDRTDDATMYADTGTIAFGAASYGTGETVAVVVTDIDRNGDAAVVETVQATITSPEDATGVAITLTETAADSEDFNGTITFEDNGGASTGSALEVDPDATITATYTEPLFDGVSDAVRTDTALMQVDGTVALDAERFDFADSATLMVSDDDLNTSSGSAQTVEVTLTSQADPTGISVTLTETGMDTGDFEGDATFSTTSSSDVLDRLSAAQGDTITLTYDETTTENGTPADRTTTAVMFIDDAVAGFMHQAYALAETATVQVTDADANLDSTVQETVDANVSSDADGTGFPVTLTETGVASGIFAQTITFTTDPSNAGARILQVAEGDTVTAAYDEPNASGISTTARTGTAAMFDATATIGLDADKYSADEDPILTVVDADRNLDTTIAETVPATLTSSSDGTGITVTLTETGVDTGIFSGAADLTTGASTATELAVAESDVLIATYVEPLFGGGTANRTDAAEMRVNGTAVLDDEAYVLPDTASLTVSDADLNTASGIAETVEVSLASSSDATGVTVTLTETGVNSGAFSGTATFTTGSSSGTALHVGSGDMITLTYHETSTFEGPDADRTDTASFPVNGTLALDATVYALDDTATITVTDADGNTDGGTAQSLGVTLASTTDATGVTVALTETGADTGVFSGAATFGTAASSGTVLQVAQGDSLTATYAEANTFEGPDAERTDTASFPVNGTIALDATVYALDDTATITVTDADANTDAGTAQSLDVTLASSTDATGVSVGLTETGADTGIFTGTATFGTAASNGTALQVAESDTLTATYAETTTFSGVDTNRTDTASFPVNGTIALDASVYALEDTATITVTDPDADADPGVADELDVTLNSSADPTGITVSLTETGLSSGAFSGTATFAAGASSGSALMVAQGGTVTGTYAESTTFQGPDADRTDGARFPTNGTVTLEGGPFALDDKATVTAYDPDLNLDGSSIEHLDVTLSSGSDPTGVTVALAETGVNTGLFTGTAGFTGGASSGSSLHAEQADAIIATYVESTTFQGPAADRMDLASMLTDGTVTLDDTAYGAAASPVIAVTDVDANADAGSTDTVTVTVTSTTDPAGIEVTLTESGPNTRVFDDPDNPVGFVTTGTSTNASNTLRITSGDTVTVTYDEPAFVGGTATRTDSASVTAGETFADVPDTYWAFESIERFYGAEITTGCGVDPLRYCPGSRVTRAQMAVFLIRAMDEEGNLEPATGVFTDVPTTSVYAPYVELLAELGVTSGCGGGKFCPSSSVTRAQMAVFLIRAMIDEGLVEEADLVPAIGVFSDVPTTAWYAEYVELLAEEGVTSGCGSGRYCPAGYVTRAQMAVFMVNAFDL